MGALDRVTSWPADHTSAAIVTPTVAPHTTGSPPTISTVGDVDRVYRLASLTKPLSAWAIMIGSEEGIVHLDAELDHPNVQSGCTLRHLLAHAGGYGFADRTPLSVPERRRMYSNAGIELAAEVLAGAADMPFDDYVTEAVLTPLGMQHTEMRGSPAHGARSTVTDMVRFVAEMLRPQLVAPETAADIKRPQYPSLAGIVPDVGRFDPCPWGLGVEIRGEKSPHWTGSTNAPSTFGHFGGSGTMMWVDPDADVGVIALTDRRFDEWRDDALRLWPEFSDDVLAELSPANHSVTPR